jgi:hypothetical protein
MAAVLQVLALLTPMLGLLAGLFWMILTDIQPPVAPLRAPVVVRSHRRVVRPSRRPYVARHAL